MNLVRTRPEHLGPPTVYYDEVEARNYASDSKKKFLQRSIATSALNILSLHKPNQLILDIGCGTGFVGELIEEQGHQWMGLDISRPMLEASRCYKSYNTVVSDMGQGVPFRKKIFDAVISISTLQWLCYTYEGQRSSKERMRVFFTSLYNCLRPEARCVFQYYPEDKQHVHFLKDMASECGFSVAISEYTKTPKMCRNFLLLSMEPWEYRIGVYSDFYWCPPFSSIIGSLLFGWKPDFRELICLAENPICQDETVNLCEIGAIKVRSSPFPCELLEKILLHIIHMSPVFTLPEVDSSTTLQDPLDARVEWEPNWVPPLTPNSFLEAQTTLRSLRCVCKEWFFFLERYVPSIEHLLYHKSNTEWTQNNIIPSYDEMIAERSLMLDYFITLLLSTNPNVNFRRNSKSMVTICKLSLHETAEIFFLDQFFIWIQLNKYIPQDQRVLLTPPLDVYNIWTIFSESPCFQTFCNYFCGYCVDVTQCDALQYIDVQQGYREISMVQRYVTGFKMDEVEYKLRDFTWRQVANLFGKCDGYTWHPEAETYDLEVSCFGGKTKIKMGDGSKKEVRHIQPGDYVMTAINVPQCVLSVEKCTMPIVKKMVRFSDFWITRGHPVLIKGDWFRPDELAPTHPIFIPFLHGIYNLILKDEHTVIAGDNFEVVCCTLGKYCGERLEKLHPNQNSKYGPKKY